MSTTHLGLLHLITLHLSICQVIQGLSNSHTKQ
jgi:hypothetical protein